MEGCLLKADFNIQCPQRSPVTQNIFNNSLRKKKEILAEHMQNRGIINPKYNPCKLRQ